MPHLIRRASTLTGLALAALSLAAATVVASDPAPAATRAVEIPAAGPTARPDAPAPAQAPAGAAAAQGISIRMVDIAARAGLTFRHHGEPIQGAGPPVVRDRERWKGDPNADDPIRGNERPIITGLWQASDIRGRHLVRINGSGIGWLDADGDGFPDLFCGNVTADPQDIGSPGAGRPNRASLGLSQPTPSAAFYRNNGDGTFTDVTVASGLGLVADAMAVAVADVNNDGYQDVLVTAFDGLFLFRNEGDGTFREVSRQAFPAGVADQWYGGAAFADFDRDGWLDLYVAGYVDLDSGTGKTDIRFPMEFTGFPNILYRNTGQDSFVDVTKAAGVSDGRRKGMQVVFSDLNGDGWPDIFVANDTDPNSLYVNNGNGTFTECAGRAWLAGTMGSMGVALGDVNGDGLPDLFISTFTGEPDVLYLQQPIPGRKTPGPRAGPPVPSETAGAGRAGATPCLFQPDFSSPQLSQQTWPRVGWGALLADLSNSGHLDLFVANGHLNATSGEEGDDNLLFEQQNGIFVDGSQTAGVLATGRRAYRAAASADIDNDGRIDIAVGVNGELSPPDGAQGLLVLLHNETPGIAPARSRQTATTRSTAEHSEDPTLRANRPAAVARGPGAHEQAPIAPGPRRASPPSGAGPADAPLDREATTRHWMLIDLVGTHSNRDACGATVAVTAGGRTQWAWATRGGSYFSASDPRIHFGLGAAPRADELAIYWPSGTVTLLKDAIADGVLRVVEPASTADRSISRAP